MPDKSSATHPDVEKFVKTSKQWKPEIEGLRAVLLSTPLSEDFKWSKPCYVLEGKNVAIIQPFKECLALMFFKGMLLKDPKQLLVANGPNSQSSKRLEFASVEEIAKQKSIIKAYVKEAIELEASGQKVQIKRAPEALPEELLEMFVKKPAFKKAFHALTPGRQRAYILYFSGAKQAVTRLSRIEKHRARIMGGKGLNDL